MQYKSGTSSFNSFVIEQTYVLENRLEEKEVSPKGSNHVKLLQEEITYLREKNKVKSDIIRMLSDKQNTYRCLHANTTDTAVPEK